MLNIEDELNKLFKYERVSRPIMEDLVKSGYNTSGVSHLNIRVENDESNLYGIIPFVFPDNRKGNILGFYTAESNMTTDGPKLPEPFQQFNDCAYVRLGMLMNCLAYLSKVKINSLQLVVMEGVDVINFKLRPDLAQVFLNHLSPEQVKVVTLESKPVTKTEEKQISLFAA